MLSTVFATTPDCLSLSELASGRCLMVNQAFVDLFDPNEPTGRRKVPVKVGIGNGTRAQLLQGVKKGDRVILPS